MSAHAPVIPRKSGETALSTKIYPNKQPAGSEERSELDLYKGWVQGIALVIERV